MSQPRSEIIDGVTYEVRHLSPDDALRVLVDLGKVGGGAFAAAIVNLEMLEGGSAPEATEAPVSQPTSMKDALEAIGEIIMKVTAAADADTYLRIVDAFMRVTSANSVPMVLNGQPTWKPHFTGKLGTFRRVLVLAAQVNLADFFGGGASILSSAVARSRGATPGPAPQPSASPAASVGGSGGS